MTINDIITPAGDVEIYDSTEIAQRIVFYRQFWLTSSTITKTEDHIMVPDQYLEKLRMLMDQ